MSHLEACPPTYTLRQQWLKDRRTLARAVVHAWAQYAKTGSPPDKIAALQAEQAFSEVCYKLV